MKWVTILLFIVSHIWIVVLLLFLTFLNYFYLLVLKIYIVHFFLILMHIIHSDINSLLNFHKHHILLYQKILFLPLVLVLFYNFLLPLIHYIHKHHLIKKIIYWNALSSSTWFQAKKIRATKQLSFITLKHLNLHISDSFSFIYLYIPLFLLYPAEKISKYLISNLYIRYKTFIF